VTTADLEKGDTVRHIKLTLDSEMMERPPSRRKRMDLPNRFQQNNFPAYNLLDHPEFYMLGPNTNPYPNGPNTNPYPNGPENEARRILDSYGGRFMYSDQNPIQQQRVPYGSMQSQPPGPTPAVYSEGTAPPPYFEEDTVAHENQPLLGHRRNISAGSYSSIDGNDHFESNEVNIGIATFWAVIAGISFSGCRLLLQNIHLNVIEVTIVGALIQILLSGLFVTLCQCHRLWPKHPAGNRHKIFLVLYAFLYGIMALSSIVVYDMLNQFDAESLTSFTILSTPLMCLIILKEPLRIWKFMLIPLILMGIIVITKPPVLFRLIFPTTATLNHEEENGNFTIGMLAGIVGVAMVGGVANAAVAATGSVVYNGTLIFYGGFASFLVGMLASRADSTQRILTPDVINIPFIDWMLMISHALMTIFGTAFLMKSIKASTPTIAIVLTKATYIVVLYSAYCILSQQVPDMLAIIGLVVLVVASLLLSMEYKIQRRLPRCLQRCF